MPRGTMDLSNPAPPSGATSFDDLVRDHAVALNLFLRAVVRDPQLADELFEETIVVAWRTLDRFDRTRAFGPWLRGIARRLLLARRRQDARRMRTLGDDVLDQVDRACAEFENRTGDAFDERLDALRKCMAALPPRLRAAIESRYTNDLHGARLADALAVTFESAKKLVQRARAQLAECVERRLVSDLSR